MEKNFATEEVLGWLKETAEKGVDFVETQTPLLANEIVAWHFWLHLFLAVIFTAMAAGGVTALYWAWKDYLKRGEEFEQIPAWVVGGIMVFLGTVAAPIALHDVIKAAVAPRIVILQYVNGSLR